MKKIRPHSFAFCGGAFGDEGKGRIVDELVHKENRKRHVILYRDNGGANAGHTIELASGKRIAFHQLPSGVLAKNTTVILGKGMVIHPGDLLEEINQVALESIAAVIKVDEMAVLSLDTHRALESVLKIWQEGGKGATGRGISPAYADVLLRHPLRVRDIAQFNLEKIHKHYKLYEALIKGLGQNLAEAQVPVLGREEKIPVGSLAIFTDRLEKQGKGLIKYSGDVTAFLKKTWVDSNKYTYIFEKSQAIGLDPRWGVYPDVTASDTTFAGIFSATEGIIDPSQIEVRAAVIKATYMSSVGTRVLPTTMPEKLATRIREDAHEYGATTRRPRGIAYLDIPALKFFMEVGDVTHLVLTHMDIVYPDTPVKICTQYNINGRQVSYRPDQEYLLQVKPHYVEMPVWDKTQISKAKKVAELPAKSRRFLSFLTNSLGIPAWMLTTGPRREQGFFIH